MAYDRLTIRNSDGSVSQPTHSIFEKVFNRLAELEDKIEQGILVDTTKSTLHLRCLKCNGKWIVAKWEEIGLTGGLTREQAEQCLKELQQ